MTQPNPTAMTAPPDTRSRVVEFDILRALCCLGVLLIHISGYISAQPIEHTSFAGIIVYGLLNEGVRYALFGFMFLSGLLLTLRHRDNFKFRPFIVKRVSSILVPYLAWVAIYFGVTVHRQLLAGYSLPPALDQLNGALHGTGSDLRLVASWLIFGTWDHLYFINMLFQMYLLYALLRRPITWLLASPRRAAWLIVIPLAIYPCWTYFHYLPAWRPDIHLPHLLELVAKHATAMAFEWMPAFALGLFCGAFWQPFTAWARRRRALLWVIMLGALASTAAITAMPRALELHAQTPINETAANGFIWLKSLGWVRTFAFTHLRLLYAFTFTALVLPAAAGVMSRMGDARPGWLRFTLSFAGASFGIYLVHPLLLYLFRDLPAAGQGISPRLYHLSEYLYLAVITLLVTGLSWLITLGITEARRVRWLRWLPKLLFGVG